ncbi:MAG: hypothetical protein QOD40_77 [Alphaproteobacteria bacterium]|jgi:hypothetical protein|nr:hypothetical protein [Alphaproteobacteria bacterium]
MTAENILSAIDRGITFLRNAQSPSGEFKTLLGADKQLSNAVFDSSPFVTSFVVYALSHVDGIQVDDIVEQGIAFLRSEMEFGGVWRYYGSRQFKHCRIPPDLDDTACACFALRIHGRRVPSNRWLFRYNRDKTGRYLTWVLTKDESFAPRFRLARMIGNLQAERARRTAPVPTIVSDPRLLRTPIDIVPVDDVDPAVNANVILFLGENADTAPAVEYLIDLMRTGVSESFSLYYKDRLALHYMIARAYLHSAPSLAVVGDRVVGDILARQQANGSFGHALAAALAASALLTFAPRTATLAGIIEFLLSAQRDDGSWPAHPFYSGPTEFWGSEELTTGLCIEALARYRKVQKVSMAAR